MCCLITFAMPKRVKPFDPPAGPGSFLIGRHRNESGGHDYGPRFNTYTLGGSCSCGLHYNRTTQLRGQESIGLRPIVRRYLASNAYGATELRLIVHWHEGLFASEPFSVKDTVYLSIPQLIVGTPIIEEDKLYIVHSPQLPVCPMP
jgi:hypothetical protein